MDTTDSLRKALNDYLSGWLPAYSEPDGPRGTVDEMAQHLADSLVEDVLDKHVAEVERLKRALAGHLFDGESLSTRDAIRLELIEQQHKRIHELLAEVARLREENRELAAELPCAWCKGTGIAPEENFGRDGDGAPMVDGDQPCPEGCRPSVSDQTPADRHVSPSPVRAQGDPQ